MNCPKCGDKAKVMETRQINECRIRRHRCKSCRYLFYTREQIIPYSEGIEWMDVYAEQRKEKRVSDGQKSADS